MLVGLELLAGGVAAGVFGSLLGLGGGILIVPLLTLAFGLPVREAVGVSLVSVIVTSGASAAVYLERRVANLRLGMLLELFTATGAVIGGAIAFLLDERVLAGLFAAMLAYVAVSMIRRRTEESTAGPAAASTPASGSPTPPVPAASVTGEGSDAVATQAPHGLRARLPPLDGPGYHVAHLPTGVVGAIFAGVLSAILGIGGGIVKVPLMNLFMGVPLRVSTATSNLMVGITASTSAIVYLLRGGIDPYIAGPVAIGVFAGAAIGSRTAHRINLSILRLLFVVVLLYTAFEMARLALGVA